MLDEPYRDGNFFFQDGQPKSAAVLACRNNIVLIDRRKVESGELRATKTRYPWAVYDASNTKFYGEWQGFKTRKEAIAAFVRLQGYRPRFNVNDLITGTVAEDEYNRQAQACPNPEA